MFSSPKGLDPDLNAAMAADAIEGMLEFAEHAARHESFRDLPGSDWGSLAEEVVEGVRCWHSFICDTGLDLKGTIHRRMRVPPVLVAPETDFHHTKVLETLREAQRAWVFGLPNACYALLRGVLEGVLVQFYSGRPEANLVDLIREVRLPPEIRRNDLHTIRKMGNSVLHTDSGQKVLFNDEDINEALHWLCILIEQAPARQMSLEPKADPP